MTRFTKHSILASTALAIMAPAATSHADPAPPIMYQAAGNGHHVEIDGDSNIHDWEATTDKIGGHIIVPGQWVRDGETLRIEPDLTADPLHTQVEVSMRWEDFEGDRRGLAGAMRDEVDADDHPWIRFVIDGNSASAASQNQGARWDVTGDLSLAGVTRQIDLSLDLTAEQDDRLQVSTEKQMLMSDFEIDPPRALLGTVRSDDEVDVRVNWLVERQSPHASLPSAEMPDSQVQALTEVIEAYARMHEGAVELEREVVEPATAEAQQKLEALSEIDDVEVDSEIAQQWAEAIEPLSAGLDTVAEADGAGAMREGLAESAQAIETLIGLAGHDHEAPVIAYRVSNQSGVAGSMWLQVHEPGGQARSPYRSSGTAEIVAIYPSRATVEQTD